MNPEQATTWYLCDPTKNKECKKRSCYLHEGEKGFEKAHFCRRTSKPEYAITGPDGLPLKAEPFQAGSVAKGVSVPVRLDEAGIDELRRGLQTMIEALREADAFASAMRAKITAMRQEIKCVLLTELPKDSSQ